VAPGVGSKTPQGITTSQTLTTPCQSRLAPVLVAMHVACAADAFCRKRRRNCHFRAVLSPPVIAVISTMTIAVRSCGAIGIEWNVRCPGLDQSAVNHMAGE
jgi:hypothetical protein